MGRPTKAQAQGWTESLLDEARALFCERGYVGATLDELAVRLRCSKHSIYRRFADKQTLFVAVVDRDVIRFVASLGTSCAAISDPLGRLRAVARAYFGFGASRDHAALYAAMSLEATRSAKVRARAAQWARQALVPLRSAIAAALPGGDANEHCEILIDLLDGAANRLRLQEDLENDAESVFSVRWNIFLRICTSRSTDLR